MVAAIGRSRTLRPKARHREKTRQPRIPLPSRMSLLTPHYRHAANTLSGIGAALGRWRKYLHKRASLGSTAQPIPEFVRHTERYGVSLHVHRIGILIDEGTDAA